MRLCDYVSISVSSAGTAQTVAEKKKANSSDE